MRTTNWSPRLHRQCYLESNNSVQFRICNDDTTAKKHGRQGSKGGYGQPPVESSVRPGLPG